MDAPRFALAETLALAFVALDGVESVALGGSCASAAARPDAGSDIDLCVYKRHDLSIDQRRAIMAASGRAGHANLGLDARGPGDEWLHAPSGLHCDSVYFDAVWMEDQLAGVLHRHEPSLGYSTCFWHALRVSVSQADPRGWFSGLQARAAADCPEPLRIAIVGKNHPLLRGVLSAWANQISKACRRGDTVSINYRLAGFLASYFDIVFAAKRVLYPGEERLMELAIALCPRLPAAMAAELAEVLLTATTEPTALASRLDRCCDQLDDFLLTEGSLPD